MEEILKNIAGEINYIKEQQNKLDVLTQNSKEVQDELKKLQQEQSKIIDKESGFYIDLQKEVDEKEKEFRQVDIERMNKDRELNQLILEKKKSIIENLEEKKKDIDDNRNINISEKIEEAKKLKTRKEELEAIIERDKKNGIPDNDQIQEFRRKRIDDLNLRLEEINNFDKLLNGQTPKEKFMEIEALIKMVEDNFDKNGFDKILGYKETSQEKLDKEEQQENEIEEDKAEKQEKENAVKESVVKENAVKENVKNNNSNTIIKQKTNFNKEQIHDSVETNLTQKDIIKQNKIILNIDKNEININEKEKAFYKKESQNKKDIMERYGVNAYFINDNKKKNIDYALVSILEKIGERQNDNQGTLVKAYLNIIKGGNIWEHNLEESMKILRDSVDIEYKFDKDTGIFANWKEKRIARNAKKLGIASLDGISEKNVFDKIKEKVSKIKDIKLLNSKKDTKALTSGKNKTAQEQKEIAIRYINEDRELTGLRDKVKVDNKDNRIEHNALNKEKQTNKENQASEEIEKKELDKTKKCVNEYIEHGGE